MRSLNGLGRFGVWGDDVFLRWWCLECPHTSNLLCCLLLWFRSTDRPGSSTVGPLDDSSLTFLSEGEPKTGPKGSSVYSSWSNRRRELNSWYSGEGLWRGPYFKLTVLNKFPFQRDYSTLKVLPEHNPQWSRDSFLLTILKSDTTVKIRSTLIQ